MLLRYPRQTIRLPKTTCHLHLKCWTTRIGLVVDVDAPNSGHDLLKKGDANDDGDGVDKPHEAGAAVAEVNDAILATETGDDDGDQATDSDANLQSTYNALVDIAKVDGDRHSPGEDRVVDVEDFEEVDDEKDDDSDDGEDKENEDDDDNEAFEDAQSHLGTDWPS